MTPSLLRASTGYLLRHPWQLGLAVLGICIGVAVMVAVDLANESSRKAFLLSMDTLNGRSTHQVVGGPGGLDESVYRDLRVVHGIRTIAPVITGYVNAGGETTRLLGIDVFAEREFRAWTSPANIGGNLAGGEEPGSPVSIIRQFLTSDGAVLLSADVASRLGVLAGDDFGIVANGRSVDASAAGVISADDGRFAGFIVADIAVAQRWLGMAGRLSRIDVRIDQGIDGGGVAMEDELAALLPPGASLLPSDARTKSTIDMSNAFMTNLTAMSFLAMLVGVFLIYNSIAFAVIQRRDLIGILRALGVTRAQTFRLIVGEAAVLGLVGAGLGILLGTWLGRHLLSLVAQTVSDHYFLVNVTDVALAGGSLARGFAAGIGATLVAAAIPALEASSYAPRLALLRSTVESKAGRALPVLALIGCATIVLAAFTLRHSGASLVAALAALFALVLGFSLCIPVAARAAVALLAPVAGRIAGVPGRLAIGGIAASLSRTGVAMVALAVAVSATVGVSLMVESFRMSVSDWLGNTLRSDIYVGVSGGSLDPELVDELAGLPEVRERSLTRRAWLEGDAGRTRIIAIEMAAAGYAGTRIRDGNPAEVWASFEDDGAVLVSDAYAWRNGIGRGDQVRLRASDGEIVLPVAAVYQSYDSNEGAILMSRRSYESFFGDSAIDSIGIYLVEGAEPEAVMARVRETARGRQEILVDSNVRIREISLGIFDRTFLITNVLYWLAVGVAVIGILGAMLALQLERSREFGILRALGMTPRQTGGLVSAQSAVIGLIAGLAALPLGLVMAWVLVVVIDQRAFGWQIDLVITPGPLLTALGLAIGAALLGGLYPAWMAATRRPALAMREE